MIAATHSVAHGVALLDAQEPFLQKSGCNRTRLLAAASDANVQKLVDAGAPAKLVAMLRRTGDDGARMSLLWLVSCHEVATEAHDAQQVIHSRMLHQRSRRLRRRAGGRTAMPERTRRHRCGPQGNDGDWHHDAAHECAVTRFAAGERLRCQAMLRTSQ